MTIQLEVGKTYRTRDGSAEHTIVEIDPDDGVAYTVNRAVAWWADTGKKTRSFDYPTDLVGEVTTGPVRQTTVTRTEIVPGTYGRIQVAYLTDNARQVVFNLTDREGQMLDRGNFDAEELDALAATLTQLANALRAIAAEKGQTR